jgi:hypothetical protein
MEQQTTLTQKEPSPAKECRTQQINAEFSNCLTEGGRYRCNYAFLFGDGYLCTHPNHRDFK